MLNRNWPGNNGSGYSRLRRPCAINVKTIAICSSRRGASATVATCELVELAHRDVRRLTGIRNQDGLSSRWGQIREQRRSLCPRVSYRQIKREAGIGQAERTEAIRSPSTWLRVAMRSRQRCSPGCRGLSKRRSISMRNRPLVEQQLGLANFVGYPQYHAGQLGAVEEGRATPVLDRRLSQLQLQGLSDLFDSKDEFERLPAIAYWPAAAAAWTTKFGLAGYGSAPRVVGAEPVVPGRRSLSLNNGRSVTHYGESKIRRMRRGD